MIVRALTALFLTTAPALAQCPRPLLYEVGGQPSAVCAAVSGYQAIGRARHIEFVNCFGSSPVPGGIANLELNVVHMHTEIIGRIWAIDAASLYGINATNPADPLFLSRYNPPLNPAETLTRVRVHGNTVYLLTSGARLLLVDVTDPAAPLLRSVFTAANTAKFNDLEVIGSYAYVAVEGAQGSPCALLVVGIGNPVQPVEVRRLGTFIGRRVSASPGNPSFYTLSATTPHHGRLDRWSLTDPTNPVIIATNSTITDVTINDDMLATIGSVVYVDNSGIDYTDTAQLFDPITLASLSGPMSFAQTLSGVGMDPPYMFLLHETGQMDRIKINTPAAPIINPNYYDNPPGNSFNVANLNNGYTVASRFDALWFLKTNPNGPPVFIARVFPSSSQHAFSTQAVLYSDLAFVGEYSHSTGNSTIRAYRVTLFPTPVLTLVGTIAQAGAIEAIDLGSDSAGALRLFYTVRGVVTHTLHTINASNPAAMIHDGTFSLTMNVLAPVKCLPGSPLFGTVPRVAVGGDDRTQIVSATGAAAMSSLGVIPAGSLYAITYGPGNNLWLMDGMTMRVFNIDTPASAVPLSTLKLPYYPHELKFIDPFGNTGGIKLWDGRFVRINANPSAPSITQIAQIGTSDGQFVFDGSVLHLADGPGGYKIIPVDFDAPPAEDPNGTTGNAAICPGTNLVLSAHMVAIPAVSSQKWYRNGVPLSDGPTGTGSTISGSTTATLTIATPGPADQALYRCDATNACGVGSSSSVVAYCYANCDCSFIAPVLNVADFSCFLTKFASGDLYANCDNSTQPPVLNVQDFGCFLTKFATGCP